MSCGVGCRCSLDLALMWLCLRPAGAALIWPLAWELPYAMDVALKRPKKKLSWIKWFQVLCFLSFFSFFFGGGGLPIILHSIFRKLLTGFQIMSLMSCSSFSYNKIIVMWPELFILLLMLFALWTFLKNLNCLHLGPCSILLEGILIKWVP